MGIDVISEVLVGLVGMPIIQVVKRYTKLSGPPMLWTALLISLFLAIPVAIWTGGISFSSDPSVFLSELAKATSIVFTAASTMYGLLKDKLSNSKK